MTPNLADTRASLLLQLHGKQYQLSVNLDKEVPALETANEMRRILASDLVAQAKFFNLMMQLFFTHNLGISEPLQREFLPTFWTQYHEDGFLLRRPLVDVSMMLATSWVQLKHKVGFFSSSFAGFNCLDFYIRWIQHVLVF